MPFPNSHHTLNQLAKCTDWKFNFETNDSHCVSKCSCLYLLPSAFQSHQLLSSPWTPLKACRQRQLRLWRAWMAFSLSLSGSIVDCKSCMLLQIGKKDWACVNIHSLCGMIGLFYCIPDGWRMNTVISKGVSCCCRQGSTPCGGSTVAGTPWALFRLWAGWDLLQWTGCECCESLIGVFY